MTGVVPHNKFSEILEAVSTILIKINSLLSFYKVHTNSYRLLLTLMVIVGISYLLITYFIPVLLKGAGIFNNLKD